jgi:hypothetical protein
MADEVNNNIFIQLKNAAGQHIFPKIDLLNTTGSLLPQSKVDGLVDALGSKLATADFNSTIANYSTTQQVTDAIAAAIAGVNSFEYEVVSELPAAADAKEHTIYLVSRSAGVKGEDVYDEYLLLNGKFELIGNTELDLSNYDTKGEVDGKIAAAKAIIDAYTVNGKAISESPVLSGADIALTGYVAIEGGVGIAATDTINAAFKKIDEDFKTLAGNSSESVGAVAGRVTTIENALGTDLLVAGSVPAALALKANAADVYTKSEIDALLGEEGVDGRFDALEDRVDTLEGEMDDVQEALDTKANSSDVDAIIGENGSLTQEVALKANAADVYTKEVADTTFVKAEALVVYYEVIEG